MKLGAIFVPAEDFPVFRRRVRQAEERGFSMVGVGDTPISYADPFVSLTLAVSDTASASLGPMVTTPLMRHPVATVRAISTLQHLSGGRIVLGMGTGGSAAVATGRPPATHDRLRDYVATVRRLMRGEPAEWNGRSLPPLLHTHTAPIWVAAYGPKTARLAGKIADVVLLATGASLPALKRFRSEVASGAQAAGRDPDDVTVWVMARGSVREDREEALRDIRANLGAVALSALRTDAQMEDVPTELWESVHTLRQRYDVSQHVVWDGPNARLVEELGLTEYLAERFAVVGTMEECRAQAKNLAEAGVAGLVIPADHRDPEGILDRFPEVVHSI